MTSDPINPLQPGSGTTRRTFMRRAATAAAGLSVPGLLAACGTTSPTGGSGSGSTATTAAWVPAACRWRGPTIR